MKKYLVVALGLTLIAGLNGCGSSPKKESNVVSECTFPGTSEAAPLWVCDAPIPNVEVSAVGVAEPSQAGISYMKDMAAADARGRLAEQMKIQVQKMVKNYLGTTGKGDAETVDAAASSTLRTLTNETLIGSKIYRSIQAPDGRYFVLVGIDKANFEKIVKNAARTSMRNDQALWQEFKAQKSFDEMAAEIAKQKP